MVLLFVLCRRRTRTKIFYSKRFSDKNMFARLGRGITYLVAVSICVTNNQALELLLTFAGTNGLAYARTSPLQPVTYDNTASPEKPVISENTPTRPKNSQHVTVKTTTITTASTTTTTVSTTSTPKIVSKTEGRCKILLTYEECLRFSHTNGKLHDDYDVRIDGPAPPGCVLWVLVLHAAPARTHAHKACSAFRSRRTQTGLHRNTHRLLHGSCTGASGFQYKIKWD